MSCPVITVPSGSEPSMFTAHFLVRYTSHLTLSSSTHSHSHYKSLTLIFTFCIFLSLSLTRACNHSFSFTRPILQSLTHLLLSSLLSSVRLHYSELILKHIHSDSNPSVFYVPPHTPSHSITAFYVYLIHSFILIPFSFLYLNFIQFYFSLLIGLGQRLGCSGKIRRRL